MKRIALIDGRWFDRSKAMAFEEGQRFDGRNHISLATGSQWEHQTLYRTASGRWVLHSWSQWQGSRATYEEIDADSAARWLVVNGCESPDASSGEIAKLEV